MTTGNTSVAYMMILLEPGIIPYFGMFWQWHRYCSIETGNTISVDILSEPEILPYGSVSSEPEPLIPVDSIRPNEVLLYL